MKNLKFCILLSIAFVAGYLACVFLPFSSPEYFAYGDSLGAGELSGAELEVLNQRLNEKLRDFSTIRCYVVPLAGGTYQFCYFNTAGMRSIPQSAFDVVGGVYSDYMLEVAATR